MPPQTPAPFRLLALALMAVAVGACDPSATDLELQSQPQFGSTYDRGEVRLQKRGPAGTTATFEISADGGTFPAGTTVTLDACSQAPCPSTLVWFGADTYEVTITEVASTAGLILERIRVTSTLNGITDIIWPEDPAVTVEAGPGNNVNVLFKNVGEPPKGLAGCTPGFWKQPQHFEYWTAPYEPGTQFGSVFADAFPMMTLLEVLQLGGGDINALGRHTVAALLNAASPNVDYGLTPAQVITAFNAAYASGDSDTIEMRKDAFEALNERGCTAKKKNR